MKKKFTLMILTIVIFSCQNNNKQNHVGSWEGTRMQTTLDNGKQYINKHQIEFTDQGTGWWKNYNSETGVPYKTIIFDYKIDNDSVYFTTKTGKDYVMGIDINTETKLILNSPSKLGTTSTYELNKLKSND